MNVWSLHVRTCLFNFEFALVSYDGMGVCGPYSEMLYMWVVNTWEILYMCCDPLKGGFLNTNIVSIMWSWGPMCIHKLHA